MPALGGSTDFWRLGAHRLFRRQAPASPDRLTSVDWGPQVFDRHSRSLADPGQPPHRDPHLRLARERAERTRIQFFARADQVAVVPHIRSVRTPASVTPVEPPFSIPRRNGREAQSPFDAKNPGAEGTAARYNRRRVNTSSRTVGPSSARSLTTSEAKNQDVGERAIENQPPGLRSSST
jgi:hypothetical protein